MDKINNFPTGGESPDRSVVRQPLVKMKTLRDLLVAKKQLVRDRWMIEACKKPLPELEAKLEMARLKLKAAEDKLKSAREKLVSAREDLRDDRMDFKKSKKVFSYRLAGAKQAINEAAEYFKVDARREDQNKSFEEIRQEIILEIKPLFTGYSITSCRSWLFANPKMIIWFGIDFWRSILIFDSFHDRICAREFYNSGGVAKLKGISLLGVDFYGDLFKLINSKSSFPLSWNCINDIPFGDVIMDDYAALDLRFKIESIILAKLRIKDLRNYLLAGGKDFSYVPRHMLLAIYFNSLAISRKEDAEFIDRLKQKKMAEAEAEIETGVVVNKIIKAKKSKSFFGDDFEIPRSKSSSARRFFTAADGYFFQFLNDAFKVGPSKNDIVDEPYSRGLTPNDNIRGRVLFRGLALRFFKKCISV